MVVGPISPTGAGNSQDSSDPVQQDATNLYNALEQLRQDMKKHSSNVAEDAGTVNACMSKLMQDAQGSMQVEPMNEILKFVMQASALTASALNPQIPQEISGWKDMKATYQSIQNFGG